MKKYAIPHVTRWKKDAREFTVSLNDVKRSNGTRDRTCRVPGPVAEALGEPRKLRFILRRGRVYVEPADR